MIPITPDVIRDLWRFMCPKQPDSTTEIMVKENTPPPLHHWCYADGATLADTPFARAFMAWRQGCETLPPSDYIRSVGDGRILFGVTVTLPERKP